MKKMLHEVKADIDSGISKSLSHAPLTVEELEELKQKSVSDLIVDHGLDSIMAEIVIAHVKKESNRLIFQDQMTNRERLKESIRRAIKKRS